MERDHRVLRLGAYPRYIQGGQAYLTPTRQSAEWQERGYNVTFCDLMPDSNGINLGGVGATLVRVVAGRARLETYVDMHDITTTELGEDEWLLLPYGHLHITCDPSFPVRFVIVTTPLKGEGEVQVGYINSANPIAMQEGMRVYAVGPRLTPHLLYETVVIDSAIPRHRHPDTSNLLLFHDGSPIVAKENLEGAMFATTVAQGCAAIINPDEPHGVHGPCTFDSIQLGPGNAGDGTVPEDRDYDYRNYVATGAMYLKP